MSASPIQGIRWHSASVAEDHAQGVGSLVARIMEHADRYKAVDALTRVPWYVIAGLHNMESGGSFACHLHEGSPLTGRTKYVPKGRPLAPPADGVRYTWEESALDALTKGDDAWLPGVDWTSLAETLYACERYNGVGYLKYHPSVPTPYLWAKTTIERRGKYVGDGKWDSGASSDQTGIAAIWKVMEQRGILDFSNLHP